MPIYAYRCESCGFSKDVLQKVSDAPLSECPTCGKSAFKKQLTAAGFQLKGTGWYVTDFRNGSSGAAAKPAPATSSANASESSGSASDSASTTSTSTSAPGSTSTDTASAAS